jgi:hypothetical protein
MSYSRFYAFLLHRWWLAFILLGLTFVAGSLLTLNLLHALGANFDFLWMYGGDAIHDGGLRQFVEMAISGYLAAASYVVFKVCEKVLVERLSMNKRNDG